MIKVRLISTIEDLPHQYAHVCPVCAKILASACEASMMPEFSICDCDGNQDIQQDDYEVALCFGMKSTYAVARCVFPRLAAIYDGERLSKIDFIDECTDDEANIALKETTQSVKRLLPEVKPLYYVQETIGGWRQNAMFSGTKAECERYYEENPILAKKTIDIVHEYEYKVDYL